MEDQGRPERTLRKTGRPLSFDRDAAVETAMLLFWKYGYETTSIADLTAAMGINAPSLYNAFGDKKRLFLEAVQRYAGDPEALVREIESAPSSHAAASQLLTRAAIGYTGEETPRGCLLASATATGSVASSDVQAAIADIRRAIAAGLEAHIVRDVTDGLLPQRTDAAALSGLVMAVLQGMSVLARDGASRETLLAIAEAGLGAWPGQ